MGVRPLIIGFVATILGGLGSLVGAAVGGFVIGIASVMLDIFLPPRPARFAMPSFSRLFLLLVARPEGLLRSKRPAGKGLRGVEESARFDA